MKGERRGMAEKGLWNNRKIKEMVLLLFDIALIILSYFLAYMFRYYLAEMHLVQVTGYFIGNISRILLATVVYIMFFYFNKQYRSIWTLAGISELIKGFIAVVSGAVVNILISLVMPSRVPLMVTGMAAILILFFCVGIRAAWRVFRRAILAMNRKNSKERSNVLIVGAGAAGALVLNEIKKSTTSKRVVKAFVDDNKYKAGSFINGVKVVGTRKSIKKVVKQEEIDEIIIAIANLEKESLNEIIDICKECKVKVKIMPGINEIIDGKFSLASIRDIDVNDLLGREAIKLDHEGISEYLEGKVVLVTGGGGSIGSELCRKIVRYNPKQLIIFDIYENNAYDIQMELMRNYPKLNLVTLIGSVRDKDRLNDVFYDYKPNVIFHAAAHKHVPLMEDSPVEAIKNNVIGTLNVAEVADKFKVEKFVLISTDKAVNPTNVMGASKRMCEMIIQAINKTSDTDYVAVRFGNVLGSNGSVVPLFKKQIAKGGPVTLTDKNITRFFMTIPEAAQLVIQAGAYAKGGEIFILDMGQPVKIYDLAVNLIKLSGYEPGKDIKIKVTGLRPGEKLYEELLMSEEGLKNTANEKIFIGKPGEYDLAKLKKAINKIMFIGINGDKDELKEAISEVVTTYKYKKTETPAQSEAAATTAEKATINN